MSMRKRSRAFDDVDGSDAHSVDSGVHHSHSKRSRVALAAERGGSVVSDEDSEIEDGSALGDARSDDLQMLASSDAEDGEEGEDDDVNEIQATQFIQKKRLRHENNIAAEQGIIEEVFCRNFMCHTKLRIRLGPLINFIIGHNGSGKSAVLTALTMCLGGKATATNRGANLKSLIKEGTEHAILAVKIKNQGDNAYKPELYGSSITVERHFSRSGTSGFKIKNADDRIITTKKSDLDDILDFFAFQLDNPINVLTQDMARQFLSNSSAADKYKFFIRGTQLETLNGDYKLIEEHQNNMEEKLALREDDIKILETRAKEAEAKKKRLDATQTIMDKIKQLERMHAWAQVQDQERLLEQAESRVERAEQDVREKETAAEQAAGTFEGHNQAWEAAKSALEGLLAPIPGLEDAHNQAKEALASVKNELMSVNAEQRTIRENVKKHKADINRLKGEVDQEQARLADAQGEAHQQRMQDLEELKGAVEEARAAQEQHSGADATLQATREDAQNRHNDAEAKSKHAREEFDRAKNRLQELDRGQGRKFAAYPDRTEQIVQDIERETRWRSKPVGPLGLHVKLLKPEWSSIIETTLGGSLNAFAVSHPDDQRLLSQILKKRGAQISIFSGNAAPLDCTSKEPKEDVDTILRVLRIDNDLVRNLLVINHFIEQTVLIQNQDEAKRFMYGSGQKQNVKATITMARGAGNGTRYEYSRGGQKASPVKAWAGAVRMQTDREEQKRMQRERLELARRDLDEKEAERRQCQTALTQAQQALMRWKREAESLRIAYQRAEDAVERKEAEIESNRPQDGRLQELERQVKEAQEELESAQASFQDSVLEKDRLDATGRERKDEVDNAFAQLDEANKRNEKALKRSQKLEADRYQALLQKNEAIAALDYSKERVTQVKAAVQQQQEVVDDYIRQASQISDRVPVEEGVTPEILDQRVARLNADYARAEREAGGSREELTRAWSKANNEYRQALRELNDMRRLEKVSRDEVAGNIYTNSMQKLKMTLNERQRRWTLFRKFISVRAKINFHYLLSERSFRGRVMLDHSNKLLDISVEPDISKASDTGRQAKTLSGGEKSFSTICLLLSIWEAIGSPIRCLDEFDVFMDSVNRTTSMTMMIQAARRAVGKQFVLITPQAMNNVEMGDDVRVHR